MKAMIAILLIVMAVFMSIGTLCSNKLGWKEYALACVFIAVQAVAAALLLK